MTQSDMWVWLRAELVLNRNILAKLHLKNRVQAAAYAVREGLIDNTG